MPERSRRIEWEQLLNEALTAPGNMQGVYDRFYHYSYLNQVFLRS